MKKYQYIFIAIFLGSMLFTVFQYLPLLEEEVHACKSLEKKSDTSSNESDTDGDSGDDENDTDDYFSHTHYNNFFLFTTHSKFNTFQENYHNLVLSITTPPPKI